MGDQRPPDVRRDRAQRAAAAMSRAPGARLFESRPAGYLSPPPRGFDETIVVVRPAPLAPEPDPTDEPPERRVAQRRTGDRRVAERRQGDRRAAPRPGAPDRRGTGRPAVTAVPEPPAPEPPAPAPPALAPPTPVPAPPARTRPATTRPRIAATARREPAAHPALAAARRRLARAARRLPRRGAAGRLTELLALSGFAFAQPILDVTGDSPDFFLYRRPTPGEMRLLVLVVAFGPALYLFAAERAVGLIRRRAEDAVHVAFVALLVSAIGLQALKQGGLVESLPAALVVAVAGARLAVLALRSSAVRQALTYAAPAPLVFLLTFALTAPSGALVRPVGDASTSIAVALRRPPVVMVVLDELPARTLLDARGEVDGRLFPGFARLAAASTRFTHATAVTGLTHRALPAMLNGTYPERPVAPSYVEYPDNLFTLLARNYRLDVHESISQLCPPDVCAGTPEGRDTGLRPLLRDVAGIAGELLSPYPAPENLGESFADVDAPSGAVEQRDGPYDLRRVTRFIDGLTPRPDPTLHFLHLLLPHVPYKRLPSGRVYERPGRSFPVPYVVNYRVPDDAGVAVVTKQRLLLQTAYVDALIGRMIDLLEEQGLWDDALVIVTADHGVGLEPNAGRRLMNDESAADVAVVPLFVKTPGQREGRVDDRNAEQIDVLPTVADVLGVPVPWRHDGVSLLGPPRTTTERRWHNPPSLPTTFTTEGWDRVMRRGVATGVVRAGRGQRGLYAVGPLGKYVGRRVEGRALPGWAPFNATLAAEVDVANVDATGGEVPAMLWGKLGRADESTPRWLLASVNGVVAGAVVTTTGTDGGVYFLGMVDDAAFTDGANEVRLHVVEDDGLRAVPWTD